MDENLKEITRFIEDKIFELESYINDPNYDELETHDCHVAKEELRSVLAFINHLKTKGMNEDEVCN